MMISSKPIARRKGQEGLVRLLFQLLVAFCLFPYAIPNGNDTVARRNEMLVPLNSTTALICEPVFNQGRPEEEEEARWMRDGHEVARVSGHSNAILGSNGKDSALDDALGRDPIPEIGFLVIQQTRRQDEGDYWCERVSDGQQGERTRLRVAFLEPFPEGTRPRLFMPAEKGQLLVLDCPRPEGLPPPILNWHFNGERLIDFSALNLQMAPNGSLLVHNFSSAQSGFYACEAANFVAKTLSQPFFLAPPPPANNPRRTVSIEPASALVECLSAYVRNGVLWFLIGCLTTSCVVLAYILGALFLYRLYAFRERHRWPRSLLSAPGFRKVVAPMAERMPPPPPYESAIGAAERISNGQLDV